MSALPGFNTQQDHPHRWGLPSASAGEERQHLKNDCSRSLNNKDARLWCLTFFLNFTRWLIISVALGVQLSPARKKETAANVLLVTWKLLHMVLIGGKQQDHKQHKLCHCIWVRRTQYPLVYMHFHSCASIECRLFYTHTLYLVVPYGPKKASLSFFTQTETVIITFLQHNICTYGHTRGEKKKKGGRKMKMDRWARGAGMRARNQGNKKEERRMCHL